DGAGVRMPARLYGTNGNAGSLSIPALQTSPGGMAAIPERRGNVCEVSSRVANSELCCSPWMSQTGLRPTFTTTKDHFQSLVLSEPRRKTTGRVTTGLNPTNPRVGPSVPGQA